MDHANDTLSADPERVGGKSPIDQSHHIASFGACNVHDGHLRTRVHQRLHGNSVDVAVDVEHHYAARKYLRVVFNGGLQVVTDVSVLDAGGDLLLVLLAPRI